MSKSAFLIGAVLIGVFALTGATGGRSLCETGKVQGYALVTGSRIGGVGAMPSTFTNAQRYFGKRFNCTGRLVEVRRVDEGRYEVRFPGNRAVAVQVSAFDDDGTSSSAVARGGGNFYVRLLGPEIDRNVLEPRDTPFVIVLF